MWVRFGSKVSQVCYYSIIDRSKPNDKTNSVHDVFIVFIGWDIQENRSNVQKKWLLLCMDSLRFNFFLCIDMKMCNLLCGLMACSSTFPCCWCLAKMMDKLTFDKTAELRTIGNIIESYKQKVNFKINNETKDDEYYDETSDQENEGPNNNRFYSVLSPPIFDLPLDQAIISIIVPPPLHLLLGVVNHLVDDLEKNKPVVAKRWLKTCCVSRNSTFGRALNGNACNLILKKAHLLKVISKDCDDYYELFRSFHLVVTSCFGMDLDPNYESYIDNFEKLYNDSYLKQTVKVHVVVTHIKHFLSDKNCGLGVFSEHAFEAIHHDYKECYKNYAREQSHPQFQEKFMKSVTCYNAKHYYL